jgi:hypothetical protein
MLHYVRRIYHKLIHTCIDILLVFTSWLRGQHLQFAFPIRIVAWQIIRAAEINRLDFSDVGRVVDASGPAGVDRGTAMKITGHRTEHVFERYNIVSTDDIREALVKVGQYAKMLKRAGRKQVAGTFK